MDDRHSRPLRTLRESYVNLSHGSGGKAMRDLIEDVFVAAFDNPQLAAMEDQAVFPFAELAQHGDRLAFTTDTFVVDPLFFAGGDIGTLAVAGTVNDLAMSGARPLYLSCAMVLEEGLSVEVLRRVVASMDVAPEGFCMVGNSVRSDVLPVLAIGGHAVHVPYHVTWAHEHAEHDGTVPTLETIRLLPAWLAGS